MSDDRFVKAPVDERPWHQKSPYAQVKSDPDERIIDRGRVYQGVNYTFTREAFDEFHAGRRCGLCHEPQIREAWPKRCANEYCNVDFKKAYDLWCKQFQGEEWVGSRIDWRAEMDRLDGELEQDNWKEHPTSGIIIPEGARL